MVTLVKISKTIRSAARVALALCGLALAAAPAPAASAEDGQNPAGKSGPGEVASAPATEAAPGLMKFEVEVTTGSGSAANPVEAVAAPLNQAPADAIKIEILDAAHGSGSVASTPGAEAARAAAPDTVDGAAASVPPLPPSEEVAAGLTASDAPAVPSRQAIFEALEARHKANLAAYTYNIALLSDPFMPIKEVRGKPNGIDELDPEEEAKLPPILRLELSQLKLVAITTLTGRGGAALASFEDGAGSSYILRRGDRIGRRNGRIAAIEPTQVTVEEPSRGASNEPRITVMKLNVLDVTNGLTYSEGE